MANLTITATNVIAVDGYVPIDLIAGEAITRGKPFYTKAADGKAWVATSEGTAAQAAVTGIALNDAAAGQPIKGIAGGDLGLGAILTAGLRYDLSDAGAICPSADTTTGDYVTMLGMATTTSNLRVYLWRSGVEL